MRPFHLCCITLAVLATLGNICPADAKLIFADKVSAAFQNKVITICRSLGIPDPNFLMAAMGFETGRTFRADIRNGAGSGATGLIQFMPSTATHLGTSTASLARMSPESQLDYVEKYFQPYSGRLQTLEDVYMAILWPAAVGKPNNFALFRGGTTTYNQNSGLDVNRDGVVTKAEAAGKVREVLNEGLRQAGLPEQRSSSTSPAALPSSVAPDGEGAACYYKGGRGTCTKTCTSFRWIPAKQGAQGCERYPINVKCCVGLLSTIGGAGRRGITAVSDFFANLMPSRAPTGAPVGVSSRTNALGLCGDYEKSQVLSIKGNRNVEFKVVKILTQHLDDPSIANVAPTEKDNTMTTTTACAFDRLHKAAKAAGVTIKISSGFRTIARQQYFYNCYITKSCNGGNLAAQPGTSNHGVGAALDLNTDCGEQASSSPPAACRSSRVYQWLAANAQTYGFARTVQSEPWHWEFGGAIPAKKSRFT